MAHIPTDAELIFYSIKAMAEEVFEGAGMLEDFCIQDLSDEHIIFGGWYRLRWHLRDGWKVLPMEGNSEKRLQDLRRSLSEATYCNF